MALFKKRSDSDIPKIPPLPEFPREQRERELPSIPAGFNEDVNRDIIKSAIGDDLSSYDESLGGTGIPSPPRIREENDRFLPQEQLSPSIIESEPERKDVRPLDGPDSIFIRIDKFRSAKKQISGIKKDLLEVEAIVNKLKEIKIKEDSEVGEINLTLDNIKKKIGDVDSLVFDKV